jgi:oxygen-independent coproporphyrinogen-3 oxidase
VGESCISAYVHVPFCASKCTYCDFNSYPGLDYLYSDYVNALIAEMGTVARTMENIVPLQTIYVGGGTPTVLSVDHLSAILGALQDSFGLGDECEITTEANPCNISLSKCVELLGAGFNRLSLGIQSFDDSLLRMLGRMHTCAEALDAVYAARDAGFNNLSLDLMYALPGQSIMQWKDTLSLAIDLAPEHISLYELTIEDGTYLKVLLNSGKITPADEDRRLSMYHIAIETITSAGYEHYEVSNFARPGLRCRHNITYWRNEYYYGFGAGATSYVSGVRSVRVAEPQDYVAAVNGTGDLISYSECLTGEDLSDETLMVGLRMLDGVDLAAVSARTNLNLGAKLASKLDWLEQLGLLTVEGSVVRVTRKGLYVLDTVISELTR